MSEEKSLLDLFQKELLENIRLRKGIDRAAESCTDPVCKRDLNELLKGEAT